MMEKLWFVTSTLVILIALSGTDALRQTNKTIKCYQCNSFKEPDCEDFSRLTPQQKAKFYKECVFADYDEQYKNREKFCRKMEVYSEL